MTPAAHLATLRACDAHLRAHGWRGARRDTAAHTFMLGALAAHTADAPHTTEAQALAYTVELIARRGYRELQTQLTVLANCATKVSGKHGKDV